jgi:GNAT superfamily N-acetyltransferase
VTHTIRLAVDTDAELAAIATVANDVSPEDPTSVEAMRWADSTYPGGARWVADLDGRVVGVGTVGRIYMYAPDFDAFWATIHVLPEVRRRGIGSALHARNGEHARRAGKRHLHIPVSEARPDGIAFLEHRGFTEYDRSKAVRLDLRGMTAPEVALPAGIVITSLALRPDLIPAVHAVAVAAFPDIPGGDRPMDPGDLAEFRARDVDRPDIPSAGFMGALDETSGTVVGYASLSMVPGSATAAWHDMTAVRREDRGRGIARALKLATIGWAIGTGLQTLDTGNDVENAPVRALNRRLGYLPLPDEITLRGPASGGIMEP